MKAKKLVLENGLEFEGLGFGPEKIAEVVFHTGMIGYQDILANPYYSGKFVCMTYPLMGNYGARDDDFGSKEFHVEGFIVKDNEFTASNFRYMDAMVDVLEANDVPFLCDIDTRMLCKVIRDEGTMIGIFTDSETPKEVALEKLASFENTSLKVKKLTTKRAQVIKANKPKHQVVCLDLGHKTDVIESFTNRKCNVVVVPFDTDYQKVLSYKPNGVIISDGPDSPEQLLNVVETIKNMMGKVPMIGVGLGHLLIAMASGANVVKMKYGHHGANQSVKNVETGKILITSQSHIYEVEKESLNNTNLVVTHINLSDNSIEALKNDELNLITSQYEPKYASGSSVNVSLYDQLIDMMNKFKGGK